MKYLLILSFLIALTSSVPALRPLPHRMGLRPLPHRVATPKNAAIKRAPLNVRVNRLRTQRHAKQVATGPRGLKRNLMNDFNEVSDNHLVTPQSRTGQKQAPKRAPPSPGGDAVRRLFH